MQEYKPKIQKELLELYIEKFWPRWRRELWNKAYRTFHPTTYRLGFSTPEDNFSDTLEFLSDEVVSEGTKLGLLNPDTLNSFPKLKGKLILSLGTNLDWVSSMLLYSVIYDLVMDFRCYKGEEGIDPNCEGRFMDDFNCLQDIYETLYDFMLELENFGVPVGDLIGSEKLKKIPLVNKTKCKHKHRYLRISPLYMKCHTCGDEIYEPLELGKTWRGLSVDGEGNVVDDEGNIVDYENTNELLQEALEDDQQVKFLLDNIDLVKIMKGPDSILLSDFVEGLRQWSKYNPITTNLSPFLTDPETMFKGEYASEIMQWATENNSWPPNYNEYFKKQEDPLPYLWSVRQEVREAMTRMTLNFMQENNLDMGLDNVNKIFKELARRLYRFILFGPYLKKAQSRSRTQLDENNKINPKVSVGDIIQLLHMEDSYNPVPIATKGIVVGFDKDPWEDRILVKWIIDDDKKIYKNIPLYPSIDAYRIVGSDEILSESTLLNEGDVQEINYTSFSEPKFYGGKGYIYFKTKDFKLPESEKIILIGPNDKDYPQINIDASEVTKGKYGGLQINYNSNTKQEIDLLFRDNLTSKSGENKCDFSWVLNPKYWSNTSWKKRLFKVILDSLKEVYSEYIAPTGLPTTKHIKNGFINLPGTDAYGTNHGWSIINFFSTNPLVRKILLKEFENFVNSDTKQPKSDNCRFNIDEFIKWVDDEKYNIFGFDTPTFKEMVKVNQSSWKRGNENEQKAAKFLIDLYDGWDIIYGGEPGIYKDALEGSDIMMIDKKSGEKMNVQVKPLSNSNDVNEKDGKWWVKSAWLKKYPLSVTHLLFGPSKDDNNTVFIFKNEGQEPTHMDKNEYMVFNSPPINSKQIKESTYSLFWNI